MTNSYSNNSPLSLLLWNSNGLQNHYHDLHLCLNSRNIDIALITETHLTPNKTLFFPNYSTIRTDHPDGTAHGGAAIFVRNNIKYSISPPTANQSIQSASIQLNINNTNTTIVAAYFPPANPINEIILNDFFSSLNKNFVIGGDFNSKHPQWGNNITDTRGRNLLKFITNSNLRTISPLHPTYWPSHQNRNPDILDFFIVSIPPTIQHSILNINELCSDHTAVLLSLNTTTPTNVKPSLARGPISWSKFKDILDIKTILKIPLKSTHDIEVAALKLTNNIQSAVSDSSSNPNKSTKSNNIPKILKEMLAQKRRARARWQSTRHPLDKHALNSISNKLKKEFYKINSECYENNITKLQSTNGSLWRKTKNILKLKELIPPIKLHNNKLAISDLEKSNAFAEYFYEVFKPNNINPPINHLNKINQSLISALPTSTPPKHFTPNEIKYTISKLKNGKAPGHDLITNNILKQLTNKAILNITHIFNAMLRLSYFPPLWKISTIILVHKHGKPKNSTSSYRPISLLPSLGKLFEKLLLKRLQNISEINKIIPNSQYGFRAHHSTLHPLHRLTDAISSSLEQKKYCSGVFLDVAQAFDKVWHDGLLYKLKTNFPAPYYLILKSYLTHRSFQVNLNNSISNQFTINAGVPQGSDLSPLLYLIYTADIPTTSCTILNTFADDTCILATDSDPTITSFKLQHHLNLLENWFTLWKIKINTNKSSHITFSLRPNNCPPVKLCNQLLPQTNQVKYLGLIFDKRLTWKDHIFDKRKKLNSRLHLLRPLLRSKLNLKLKILIYKMLIFPLWYYGIQIWGNAAQSNIQKIQSFQSICLRTITKSPWYVSNKTLHSDLRINYVKQVTKTAYQKLHKKFSSHRNPNISYLASQHIPDNPPRRLKRKWVRDLLH